MISWVFIVLLLGLVIVDSNDGLTWSHYISVHWPKVEVLDDAITSYTGIRGNVDTGDISLDYTAELRHVENLFNKTSLPTAYGGNILPIANAAHNHVRQLTTWLRSKYLYREPHGIFIPTEDMDTLVHLIRKTDLVAINMSALVSYSDFTTMHHKSPNPLYAELGRDMRKLKVLFEQRLFDAKQLESKPNQMFAEIRAHDVILRILSVFYQSSLFKNSVPDKLGSITSLRKGFLPVSLINPDQLVKFMCTLSKNIHPTYELSFNCHDWAYYYSNKIVSVAFFY